MGRPKDSDRRDVRALILEQAKKLFYEQGYGQITIRKIAREIGYSPAAIYLYFQNKDEILYELHNEGFRLLYEYKMRVISDGVEGPEDRLNKGGLMYINFALDNPEYYEVMFNMPEPRDFMDRQQKSGDVGERVDYAMLSYRFLREGVQGLLDAGHFPGVDVDTAAFAFWAFVHGLVSLIIRKRIPYPQAPTRELAHQVMEFFMFSMAQRIKAAVSD
ncbi:MAG: TetR/AcrR family transcriptional regulator [Proteobacteria bacterium]|nr:TetR/AcrR family transcriptional regulator [Pseudomonadota bacterium]